MGKNLADRARQASAHLLDDQRPVVNRGDKAEVAIASMQSQFAALMPDDGETARRIVADAIQLLRASERLRECDPMSVLGGLVTCAQLNLRPGVGGEAWLIPMRLYNRGMVAQLIIGYQGVLTLARRSDLLGDAQVIRVYENDRFEFSWDYDRLVHEVNWQDPGRVVAWYVIVKMTNGVVRVERPWSRAMMEEHRDKFAMAKKNGTVVGPWRDHFDSMADKTALLRALKTSPRSYDLQSGLYADGSTRTNVSHATSVFAAATPVEQTMIEDAAPAADAAAAGNVPAEGEVMGGGDSTPSE